MDYAGSQNIVQRAGIAAELARFYSEVSGSVAKPAPRFSLSRALTEMATRGLTSGYEREVASAAAMIAGKVHDENRVILPWSVFAQRDLTTANTGAFLRPTDNLAPVDILRPWSVALRAGVAVLPNLAGNVSVPKTITDAVPYWLSTEATAITATTPELGQVALTPRTAGALVTISHLLLKQAPNVEQYIANQLLRVIGTAVDQAILNGAGAEEPLGILNTVGLATTSGSTLGQTGVAAMVQAVTEANADESAVSFISTPAIKKLLSTRERASGSGFVWDNGRVAGQPGYATSDMPAATMICGHWPSAVLGLWGPGIQIDINPHDQTLFKTGAVQMRVLVSCDVAVLHLAAFNAASSIT